MRQQAITNRDRIVIVVVVVVVVVIIIAEIAASKTVVGEIQAVANVILAVAGIISKE